MGQWPKTLAAGIHLKLLRRELATKRGLYSAEMMDAM
jgi:hypothetical protein